MSSMYGFAIAAPRYKPYERGFASAVKAPRLVALKLIVAIARHFSRPQKDRTRECRRVYREAHFPPAEVRVHGKLLPATFTLA